MTPPSLLRLTAEDLILDTDQKRDNIATLLNRFISQTITLFNGNITVGDNIRGEIFTITFTTSATYVSTDDFTAISLTWDFGTPISVVVVGSVKETADSTKILKSVMNVDWDQPALNTLRINFISGLNDSTRYEVNLLVL